MRKRCNYKVTVFCWLGFLLLTITGFSVSAQNSAQRAPHYEMQVFLDPLAQQLNVIGRVTTGPLSSSAVRLNAEFQLSQFSVNAIDIRPDNAVLDAAENLLEFAYSADLSSYTGDQFLISESGSYLPASANWYPVLTGIVGFTYSIQLSTVAGQKIVASGRIVNEQDKETGYTVSIESDHMARALNLYTGPYDITEKIVSGRRLRSYFHTDLSPLADGYLQSTAEYIDGYEKLLGDFPFSGFFIVSAPFSAGYGYPGLTYIGQRVLRLPFIRTTSLRHEILHNYWGNGVYTDYSKGNWAEGLTTYLADYESAREKGRAEATRMRYQWLRDFAALPSDRDRPARSFVSKEHGASQVIGYNKVAFLFHALWRELGEDNFNRLLRKFWQEYQFDSASWDEIQSLAELVSQRDLAGLFARHLDQIGAPELVLENVSVTQTGKTWQVRFSLMQRGSHYSLAVPIVVMDAEGISHSFEVTQNGPAQEYELSLDSRPSLLSVDPEFHLFRQLTAGEKPPVLRDLFLSSRPQVVLASDDAVVTGLVSRLLASPTVQSTEVQEPGSSNTVTEKNTPLLLIGYAHDVKSYLQSLHLGQIPEQIRSTGTAQVWSGNTASGRPFVVVSAVDSDALRSLYRPLPHYGRQGYLAFEGSRATIKGTWPSVQDVLSYRFGD